MDAFSVKLSQAISHLQGVVAKMLFPHTLPGLISAIPETLKAEKQIHSIPAKGHRSTVWYYENRVV